MAESSSSTRKTVLGTMIWMDLNSKRHLDWRTYVAAYPSARDPFQTYLIHSQNINSGVKDEKWWAHQSNVHGVVIAANSLSEEAICSYPRALGTIVEHFIPNLVIAETDVETAEYTSNKDILSFSGNNQRSFLSALHIALECLREALHSARSRKEASHAGSSLGVVLAALQHCHEEATDTAGEDVDLSMSGTLRTAQTTNAMQRLPDDLRLKHNPDKQWESVEDWVINQNRPKMMQDSAVSVLGEDAPTSMIMEVLEEELKVACDRAVRNAPIRGAIMCKNLVHKLGPSTKRAKTEKTQSTMILNLNYGKHTSIFRKETMINSVVWVIRFDILHSLMKDGSSAFYKHGEPRVVMGQTQDKRRIQVKPPLTAAAELNAPTSFICVLLADIHQYVFLYKKNSKPLLRD